MDTRPSYSDRIANLTERCVPFASLSDARARLGAIADTTEGLGADPAPEGQPNFWYDLVCPEHSEFRDKRMYENMPDWDRKSSCALVARSHLRRLGARSQHLGLDAEGVRYPYEDETAVENVYQVGGTSSPHTPGAAWVVAADAPPPENVVCLIGEGGAEHVFIPRKVVIATPTSGQIESLDGGQLVATIPNTHPPAGYQGILRKTRSYVIERGRVFIGGRPLIGWLDPNLLELPAPPTYDFI